MSIEEQLKKIEELYTQNIQEKGIVSSAVGWNTDDCQFLRFHKLSSYIQEENYTVNDYGCGFGAHLKYLTDIMKSSVSQYNGYDLSQNMLDSARKYLDGYEGKLVLKQNSDIDTIADYSFVSGTFNVRFDAEKEEWESFIKETLRQLSEHSTKGFSFNMLTSYVDWEEKHLYYGDPCYWFDYCKNHFSKQVVLLHDYHLWEWTMIVKK